MMYDGRNEFFLGVVIIRILDHQAKPDDAKILDLTKNRTLTKKYVMII